MANLKEVHWVGASLDDLKQLPMNVAQMAGYQLHLVQMGMEPSDWKPMKTVGQGVKEIRIRESTNTYRVIYVVVRNDGIYVLHTFQKRTKATSQKDINLAKRRYNEVVRKQ